MNTMPLVAATIFYTFPDDQTQNMVDARVCEVGVLIVSITTLRLYIVTDFRKLCTFFEAVALLAGLREFSLIAGLMAIITGARHEKFVFGDRT
jgi:hypothetical protein